MARSYSPDGSCAQVSYWQSDLEQLFTPRFELDQAHEAYELFDQQTTGKGVFEF